MLGSHLFFLWIAESGTSSVHIAPLMLLTPVLARCLSNPQSHSRVTSVFAATTSPILRAFLAEPSILLEHRGRRTMATAQPEWRAPPEPSESVRARLPRLSVYNSLTRSKTPFVPIDPEGKKVGWYACGPTVYDDAVCLVQWLGGDCSTWRLRCLTISREETKALDLADWTNN